jgi:hypothetical protein
LKQWWKISLLIALAGLIWFQRKQDTARRENLIAPVMRPNLRVAQQEAPRVLEQGTTATNESRRIILRLLNTPAGQVAGREPWEWVCRLKEMGVGAIPEIERLLGSTNAHERLLGFYLMLETQGPSEAVLARALADPSLQVTAQAAQWLYRNSKFEEWERITGQAAAAFNSVKLEKLLPLLDRNPLTLEVPAAMSILQLGRAFPDFLSEILRRNSEVAAAANGFVSDVSLSATQRENLLGMLASANVPGYVDTLKRLVAQSADTSAVRRRALVSLMGRATDSSTAEYLRQLAAANPQDPLARQLSRAGALIQARSASHVSSLQAMEKAIEKTMTAQNPNPGQDPQALLGYYIEMVKRESPMQPNTKLLQTARQFYTAQSATDYAQQQRVADIDYLLWRMR